MSLFPAYQSSNEHEVCPNNPKSHESNSDWTRNESFKIEPASLNNRITQPSEENYYETNRSEIQYYDKSKNYSSSSTDSASDNEYHQHSKRESQNNYGTKTKRQKRKHSRSRSRSRSKSRAQDKPKHSRLRSPSYSPRHKYKKKKDKKKKHKKRSKDNNKSRENKIPQFVPYKTFLEDFNIKDENELRFAEDRYGDHQFLSFNSLPERKTAKYHRKWKMDFQVLGSVGLYRNKKSTHEKKLSRFYFKDAMKLFSNSSGSENVCSLAKCLNIDRNPDTTLLYSDLIKLDSETQDSKAISMNYQADETYSTSNKETSTVIVELDEIHTKTKEFNSKLRQIPDNVKLWLDYVAFQDTALCNTDFSTEPEKEENSHATLSRKTVKARNVLLQKRAVIEKKLSILKTASEKNPNSIVLAVERLKLSKELYDNATLDRQWKELIFLHPGNIEVWKYYLSFNASHFTTFSVNKLSKSYKNYFLKLKQMHGQGSTFINESFKKISGHINSSEIEDEMVKLILRIANHWTRAGYMEKTIALFQALLELNLNSPDFPGAYSLEDRLATFEPFWESGSPRIGDRNAEGWANVSRTKYSNCYEAEYDCERSSDDFEDNLIKKYVTEQAKIQNTETNEDEGEDFDSRSGEPRLWLRLELERERKHWKPWRSHEEEAEDPDRSVGFEDIQDFLFQFPMTSLSTNSRPFFNLILGFLRHLGIDVNEPQLEVFGVLSTHTLEMRFENYSSENIRVDEKLICNNIMQNVSTNIMDACLQEFIRNIFRDLSKTLNEPYKTQIVILWLRFETKLAREYLETVEPDNFIKNNKKARIKLIKNEIKTIMDHDRENVDIYCAYANFVGVFEGYKNSSKIYSMLLQSKCQNRGVTQNKAALKIYLNSICNELNEVKKIKDATGLSNENSVQEARNLHLYNVQWLLHLMSDKAPYKDCSIKSEQEMKELVERSAQKNSHWIHKQLAGSIDDIIRSSQGGNDNVEIIPVTYYNEFVVKVFMQVWLLYFESDCVEEPVKFVQFICNKLAQKKKLTQCDTLDYVIESTHKIKIDLLLYDQSVNSIQLGKTEVAEALKDYPCNSYLLQMGVLSNKFNIQTNVTSSTWKSITTSLMRNKFPSQSFVISILVRLLLDRFMKSQELKESNQTFDFKYLVEHDDVSVGHLNQAQALIDRFIKNNGNDQISSPVIWRLLLWITRAKHEINPAKYPLANVKTMFYRACQDNPGAKVFFLDTMNYCESATKTDIIDMKGKYVRKKFRNTSKAVRETQTELQNLMTEKEIHIRIPIEELIVMLEPEDMD